MNVVMVELPLFEPPVEQSDMASAARNEPPCTADHRMRSVDTDVISVCLSVEENAVSGKTRCRGKHGVGENTVSGKTRCRGKHEEAVIKLRLHILCVLAHTNNLFRSQRPTFRLDPHQFDLECTIFLRLGRSIRPLRLTE